MMIGLDLALIGLLEPAFFKGFECKHDKDVKVHVQTIIQDTEYDFSKSIADLRHFKTDTDSPYSAHEKAHLGGLMYGEIHTDQRIHITQEINDFYKKACLHYETIEVDITLEPVIYVAKDYREGSCKHKAVLAHEHKHLSVDKKIVTIYADRIKQALEKSLDEYGTSYGPMTLEEMGDVQTKLEKIIEMIVQRQKKAMVRGRLKQQQKIDTREEYESVSNACR